MTWGQMFDELFTVSAPDLLLFRTHGLSPHFFPASFAAAPMFSRCVRVFHVSSVSQFSRAPSAHSASHGMAGGDDSPRAEQ